MNIIIGSLEANELIAYQGVKWSRNDYAPAPVTTMDGTVWRGRVATKVQLDLTFKPLTWEQLRALMEEVKHEYIEVIYDDPIEGNIMKTMYCETLPAQMMLSKQNGTEYWNGVMLTLKER